MGAEVVVLVGSTVAAVALTGWRALVDLGGAEESPSAPVDRPALRLVDPLPAV